MSGWTDERVEQLKKLWLLGWSASQIAKELGAVTRNAVIGKIHRLDLVARQSPKMTPPSALAGFKSSSFIGARADRLGSKSAFAPITIKQAPVPASPYKTADAAFAELAARGKQGTGTAQKASGSGGGFAPLFKQGQAAHSHPGLSAGYGSYKNVQNERPLDRITSGSINRQCQWPVGDPRSAGFHFCGCQPAEALPYCSEHARLAYQPSATRRKVNVGGGDLHASGTPDERDISVRL